VEELAPLSYSSRGLVLERLGQPTTALADHEAALALEPDNVVYLKNRGLCHRTLGDYAAAAQDFSRWAAGWLWPLQGVHARWA
jgi:tetratricopeptide (TPR) repeat protein